jgi:hypothetical protein
MRCDTGIIIAVLAWVLEESRSHAYIVSATVWTGSNSRVVGTKQSDDDDGDGDDDNSSQ